MDNAALVCTFATDKITAWLCYECSHLTVHCSDKTTFETKKGHGLSSIFFHANLSDLEHFECKFQKLTRYVSHSDFISGHKFAIEIEKNS